MALGHQPEHKHELHPNTAGFTRVKDRFASAFWRFTL